MHITVVIQLLHRVRLLTSPIASTLDLFSLLSVGQQVALLKKKSDCNISLAKTATGFPHLTQSEIQIT